VCVTEPFENARLLVKAEGETVFEDLCSLAPGKPYLREVVVGGNAEIQLLTSGGQQIIQYTQPEVRTAATLPDPATEAAAPKDISSNDELYITGLHLEQYRHATRLPEPYWEEALARDPWDSRCNTALGLLKLRRGQLTEAEMHFRRGIERQTRRNPNPAEGDTYYYLGLTLQYQERLDEAYAAYYKATWNYAWQSAAYYNLAAIECRRLDLNRALEHLEKSLQTNVDHLKARNLRTTILRRLGAREQATAYARETQDLDPVDFWSRHELAMLSGAAGIQIEEPEAASGIRADIQLRLDLAFDYAAAGFWEDARDVLSGSAAVSAHGVYPVALYLLGYCADKQGDHSEAMAYWTSAAKASPDYCFPARIEEMIVLQVALKANPLDARASYYLGNLFYDKKRYEEAIREWEVSVTLDATFSIPWRNLGIAYFNIQKTADKAHAAYESAFKANPRDSRLLYEWDQLRKRTGASATQRLTHLEAYADLVSQRDDLTVEFISLLNQTGRPEQALDILLSRRFNPWEGGEGLVASQYVWTHILIGRSLLDRSDWEQALEHFSAARAYPENLGEGKHLLTRETDLDYFSGVTLSHMGKREQANTFWARAAADCIPITWMTYYAALSLDALGRKAEAAALLREMRTFAEHHIQEHIDIDYFATSLPNLLLFDDDLQKRNRIDCLFLLALSELGMRDNDHATELLNEVLILDCNHLSAQEELRALTGMPMIAVRQ
jgi:tetratricopeptide (TPR) repeat protein